jgi:hypothetical protein
LTNPVKGVEAASKGNIRGDIRVAKQVLHAHVRQLRELFPKVVFVLKEPDLKIRSQGSPRPEAVKQLIAPEAVCRRRELLRQLQSYAAFSDLPDVDRQFRNVATARAKGINNVLERSSDADRGTLLLIAAEN